MGDRNLLVLQAMASIAGELLGEAVDDVGEILAEKCITEAAEEYLYERRTASAYDRMVDELLADISPAVVATATYEVNMETVVADLLDDVQSAEVENIAHYEFTTYRKRIEYDQEMVDKQIIERHVNNIITQRVLVSHLMSLSVASSFDSVLVKHFARGLVDRMAMTRLLSIIDTTEDVLLDSKRHVLMQALYKEVAQPLIKELLLQSTLERSDVLLDEIDAEQIALEIETDDCTSINH